MGMRTPGLAGHAGQSISTGEGREFPGARPACWGTRETHVDNAGCSIRARTEVLIKRMPLGVRFGREPKCS